MTLTVKSVRVIRIHSLTDHIESLQYEYYNGQKRKKTFTYLSEQ